jgi:Fe-S-cluster-containing dehydrogenase component
MAAQLGFRFDANRCVQCHACEVVNAAGIPVDFHEFFEAPAVARPERDRDSVREEEQR